MGNLCEVQEPRDLHEIHDENRPSLKIQRNERRPVGNTAESYFATNVDSMVPEVRQLFEAFLPTYKLSTVRIVRKDLDSSSIAHLTALFSFAKTIETIEFVRCFLTHESLGQLLPALRGLQSLRKLCLPSNDLRDEGVVLLAKDLETMKKLEELVLDDNQITTRGAGALAQSFPTCPLLRSVWLQRNKIDEAGLLALINWAHRANIRELQLQNNLFPLKNLPTKEGVKVLVDLARE